MTRGGARREVGGACSESGGALLRGGAYQGRGLWEIKAARGAGLVGGRGLWEGRVDIGAGLIEGQATGGEWAGLREGAWHGTWSKELWA